MLMWLGDPSLEFRGISPRPFTADISGPVVVEYDDPNPTWTADVTGGFEPFTYNWLIRNQGSSTWSSMGNDSALTLQTSSISDTFDLKVVVKDSVVLHITTSDSITVNYIPEPPPPPPDSVSAYIDGEHPGIAYYEGYNEWWAVVTAGEPPFSYEWEMRVWYEEIEKRSSSASAQGYYWSSWESLDEEDSIYVIDNDLEGEQWAELAEIFEYYNYEFEIGSLFQIRVTVTDNNSSSTADTVEVEIDMAPKKDKNLLPKAFALSQNYPNPFNPVTKIEYQLPVGSNVTLVIYNIQGQEVARLVDGYVGAGYHTAVWNAGNMASGIYLYRLKTSEGFAETRRMLLIK
jgi:hypothetical protein